MNSRTSGSVTDPGAERRAERGTWRMSRRMIGRKDGLMNRWTKNAP